MATTEQIPAPAPVRDHMPLNGIDHVELSVGNAAQAAYFFTYAYGFRPVAYSGLETGERDRTSHVLEQGRVRLVVTGTLHSDTAIAAHHGRHGDGVKVIALSVPDVANAYAEATARGAVGLSEPHWLEDDHGRVQIADIATYGDTVHRFVDRSDYYGTFLPGYGVNRPGDNGVNRPGTVDPGTVDPIAGIDHIVGNVHLGQMERWVKY